ncbi:DNA-binding transcriptional regulator, XRE-family HTH domain [Microbacterium enclense]|uniref:DNA-binding transcriptional regulator, XRE-family HTH domain n=1 Tax=Microbacterium enclense TaxID=993073 RepID=A0A1G6ICJ3_9MICO|nr:helix-turn-helix transcriptional regulator [Microbacterium enclense]SDC04267.1 DNA-binding transcriptional regulator, XRE-family HTH domain [Microbacterium enclense]
MWSRLEAQQFGARVRQLRTQSDLTQEQLAQLVGLTQNHVQLLEAGRNSSKADGPASNPRMTTVYRIADAFGLTPHDLLPAGSATPEE